MLRPLAALILVVGLSFPTAAVAQISLTVANGGFEAGAPTQVPTGWTVASGQNPFWIGSSQVGAAQPPAAYLGSQYISASWEVAGLPNSSSLIGGANNAELIYQDIDLTPHVSQINQGNLVLGLSYAFHSTDGNDVGSVRYDFYNPANTLLGAFNAQTTTGAGWQAVNNLNAAAVPTASTRLRISLGAGLASGGGGSARNIAFDAIGASLQLAPPPDVIRDRVNGNLIQFNNDGVWSWYMDERVIHDPVNNTYLINSITSSDFARNAGGVVRVTTFDPDTGARRTVALSDIDEDDHNAGGLLTLPDGRYLTMYSNHGSPYSGDNFTRWRVSTVPHEANSWAAEKTFNWNTTPGWAQEPFANSGVSYHNVYYLPAENKVINFSRGTHMAMNLLTYDPATNDVAWSGQLQRSETVNYGQGYFKFASNGNDRIYFIGTETHPYDVNTSIYSGYYSGGKTYKMDGTLMDAIVFDNLESAPGASVPYTEDFTVVQQADPVGAGSNFLWSADLAYHAGGSLTGLYTSKFNGNDNDQRLHYAYWDGAAWQSHEVAKMGPFLIVGQEEYTGVGAVVPNQPGTIYVSTPINPVTGLATGRYEIYKGVTNSQGANWQWTAVTEDSSVDNLRPIAERGANGETIISWFRGSYPSIHNNDAAIVGVIERPGASLGLTNYVDAGPTNTTLVNGAALTTTGPSSSPGSSDNQWHRRTGVGNGDGVYSANESGGENAPTIRTTIQDLDEGTYDIFAYFWSDNDEDWRLLAGLSPTNLVDFRKIASQHAEMDEFVSIDAVAANANDLQLYRAYVGRTSVADGADIQVFIDDWNAAGSASNRTWYDGVGYALVTNPIDGDFDFDGDVDGGDLLVWQRNHAVGDLADWRANFGAGAMSQSSAMPVPEPGAAGLLVVALVAAARRRRLR
jgi:MYXO-CTERM domain-containing protein